MTVDDGKTISQNQILITAPSESSPFSSSWMMATNSSVACLDIETTLGDPGTWSVNDPFWTSEDITIEAQILLLEVANVWYHSPDQRPG